MTTTDPTRRRNDATPVRWMLPVVVALVVLLGGCALEGGTTSTTVSGPSAAPTADGAPSRWVPAVGSSWQYQLQGDLDMSVDADVFVVDLFDVDAAAVDALQASGRRVVCYFSAGSLEPWRPDAGAVPSEVIGRAVEGWPDEAWFDIRRLDLLGPLMAARMDLCRSKGFDAVEADNVDAFANDTGFPLTAADQLAFNRMMATLAHDRGLSIGLKNDLDQVQELEPHMDFAVNESCVRFDECGRLAPFLEAGKAVFHVEYGDRAGDVCPDSPTPGFSSIGKRRDLGAWRISC